MLQEYTLAHIDKPDTLAGAEKALKKHEDFVSTMEANQDKVDGAVQSGQRLVDSNNMYSGKLQEKMDSIQDRLVGSSNCSCLTAYFYFIFGFTFLNLFPGIEFPQFYTGKQFKVWNKRCFK